MKFRCERDVLVDALNSAGRAVSSRGSSLPVLSGVRLELVGDTLSATGSDLDLTITATVTVDGLAEGIAVLPAKLATDIVRVLEPGAVNVEIDGDEATISSGRSQFAVRTIPAAEFPRIVEPAGEGVTLDGKVLVVVECNPKFGPAAFDAVVKYGNGETLEPRLELRLRVGVEARRELEVHRQRRRRAHHLRLRLRLHLRRALRLHHRRRHVALALALALAFSNQAP